MKTNLSIFALLSFMFLFGCQTHDTTSRSKVKEVALQAPPPVEEPTEELYMQYETAPSKHIELNELKNREEILADAQIYNTEAYAAITENNFKDPTKVPLSTFSIDVDNAAYSNVRRFLTQGQAPPKDAVRIEEMVNYFSYQYPAPKGNHPVSITTEYAACPWNPQHRLLHIGLKAKDVETKHLPASNLVFLIDVSGSMDNPQGLPLVKAGFKLLVEQLRAQDKVAIVVYAGSAGEVLSSTSGNQKDRIMQALDRLEAGGSTAGGEGIELAYAIAQKNFIKGGNNRIVLATDGDFN
ncbi:MAG: vWA domain-containing protein, partial [Rufibacter sp.]